MTVSARLLADEVWDLLRTVTNVNHFRGEVASAPPLDPDGRVHAYDVFYPGAGWRASNRLGAGLNRLEWTFQVTCVGGDDNRCLWCVDKVRAMLTGARIQLDGARPGRIRELGDRGPVIRDDDVNPPRYFLPLDFGVYVAG